MNKLASRFLLLAILLVLIGIGMDRGRHQLTRDGMVDTINHESAHASVEVKP